MINIGFIYGTSEGQVLEYFGKEIFDSLEKYNIKITPIDIREQNTLLKNLNDLILLRPHFIFSYAGIGSHLQIEKNNKKYNLWEEVKIPFISLYGDSPAYRPDLHQQDNKFQVGLYGSDEHLRYRLTLNNKVGLLGMAPIWPIPTKEKVNFNEKENGNLIFLKNYHNHIQNIINGWNLLPSLKLKNFLHEACKQFEKNLNRANHKDIVFYVDEFIRDLDWHGDSVTPIRHFLVQQLDSCVRTMKINFLVEIFLQYPVELHGTGWDHLSDKKFVGKIIPYVDFKRSEKQLISSLATFNISPNSESNLFHDRILRSAGVDTLCISNYSDKELNYYGFPNHISYSFDEDSIRASIEWIIKNKKNAVEIGKFCSSKIKENHSLEHGFNELIEISSTVSL